MEKLTHWKKLRNTNYLGSWDFEPMQDKILTIKEIKQERVFEPNSNTEEECTICYWVENEKPLILNTTNSKTINKITGTPYIEKWQNCKIQLFVKKVKAFGETVDAIRIRPFKPKSVEFKCIICGKEISEVIHNRSVEVFGVDVCCQECAEKYKSRGGKK